MFTAPLQAIHAIKTLQNHLHYESKVDTGDQMVYFYFFFFKRPERYNQEVSSHSFICLPLPCMKGIDFICNIDLYCVKAIFNVRK